MIQPLASSPTTQIVDERADGTAPFFKSKIYAREFARIVAQDLALARELLPDSAAEISVPLGIALGYANFIDADLTHYFDTDLAVRHTAVLGCALDDIRERCRPMEFDTDLDSALSRAHYNLAGLVEIMVRVSKLSAELSDRERRPMLASASTTSRPTYVPVPRSAERLIHLETWLLPTRDRGRYSEELRAELHDLAQAKATTAVLVLYALQQLGRVWQLRAALQAPDRPRLFRLHRLACWILASDVRTWGLLGPLMTLAIINVHLQQGWGSAFYTLTSVVGFYVGVEALRKRWGVTVKRRERPGKDS